MSEVQEKIRDVRTEGANSPTHGVLDAAETSEADIQDDIEFALIQMKAETLTKIEEALRRLEEGTFGYCFECGEEISERRLRALAVRGPLQGLRRGPRSRPAARAACCSAAAPPRSSSTCRADAVAGPLPARPRHARQSPSACRRRATFRRLEPGASRPRGTGPAVHPQSTANRRPARPPLEEDRS